MTTNPPKAEHDDGPLATWRDDGTLISGRFNDVYFSVEGGLAETQHVFLQGCDLPQRWQDRRVFTIGETGFGTGLNFLTTWQAFREAPGSCKRLHFISVEGYPLAVDDLAKALKPWPELAGLADALLAQYGPAEPGLYRYSFDDDRVLLTLVVGEAAEAFGKLEAKVDAWFLDGFSPARNPEMWRDEVMDQVARLSAPDAVAASFTVARAVRDRLEARGFTVEKAAGFGRKRDCLKAFRSGQRPSLRHPNGKVTVIGAGIAGACLAQVLAQRGLTVSVYDPHPDGAQSASYNPVGIVMPRLHLGEDPVAEFNRAAWRYATDWYGRLNSTGDWLDRCGVLQLARSAEEAERQQRLAAASNVVGRYGVWVDAAAAAEKVGEPVAFGGLWLPEAGWVSPAALCPHLLGHPSITVHQQAIGSLIQSGDGWQLLDNSGEVVGEAQTVVVANGLNSRVFDQLSWQPLRPKRGQLSLVEQTDPTQGPDCVVTFGSYLGPVINGRRALGATYDKWDDERPIAWPVPLGESDDKNLSALGEALPVLAAQVSLGGKARASLRATTPDHLPLAGAAPNAASLSDDLPGLFMLTGLGSTGLVTAPLCAAHIASALLGEPSPLTMATSAAVEPRRFLTRAAKRGTLDNLVSGGE
ncbi:MAG: bifunctional tRNA (5-methylaminomethyl-2-thiouridine)(34)-methyltransferase MnmD/FAD-dependent 5-carboxymethylaminomethyl-2-thiouridine(34) oxidoreductase MnmC [Alphaproteobacteria bacterium]|nr:bifunctional tRNA (5-methylaminomethyl-2-thiouridine)(34)-methyltransferase MnmD/FAD-dependent 5-carboxymethylaminomethyl-2-thiouridine(34) oxidoreductase MnmC [Alphaproteobacteria bacterium SS10]